MTTPTTDATSRPSGDDHEALRLWLRLFTCTTLIEREIGTALKREFDSSLPRFDLLAQLDRAPTGLRMGELSERLLVTGGNVTWLVRSLEAEGLVAKRRSRDDGRASLVQLTAAGRRAFATMARAHEGWIARLLQGVPAKDRRPLRAMLEGLQQHLRTERTHT